MEFLNIGSAELLFLVLIAILVVGPRRAAELASQGGRLMARLRREWVSVRRDLMAEVASLERETSLEGETAERPRLAEPGEDKAG
jgi:Sec-independent protein translocase protein TatA